MVERMVGTLKAIKDGGEWESAVLVAAESIVEADMADRQGVRVICG
jgi:hypothetical protein